MKKIFIFIILLLTNNTFANNSKITIDVNGLVCEFCAVTIDKKFSKMKDIVKNVEVDLEKKKVFLEFSDGKNLSDQKITDIIRDNGYNVVKINR